MANAAHSASIHSELRASPPTVPPAPGTSLHGQFDDLFQAAVARVLLPRRDDGPQAIRLRSYFIAAGTSLLAIGLLLGCFVQGALPRDAFLQVTVVILSAILAFYMVFRTGLNLAARDPSLTVPQMAVATLVVLYATYAADHAGSGVFPILLVMIFLFGVLRLRTGVLLIYALFMLAAHAMVIVLRWRFKPDAHDLSGQFLQWVALAVTLPWFALMGGYISGLREKLRKSNSEQRIALQSIKASEARLADAQRIAGLGNWTFDVAHKLSVWSPETYGIFGMDPARTVPVGDEFLQLIHKDDRQHYLNLIMPARDEGRSFDSQYRIVLPGGKIRWLHVVGEPVVDSDGQTTQLRGTVMDITARKTQETAIKLASDQAAAAQAMLVDAIECLTEAFALFDADDRLTLCNRRYAETFTDFGTFDEIEGMTFADLVRTSVAKGEVIAPEFGHDLDAWVAHRVWHHRNPGPQPRELELGGGRWVQVIERPTSTGGIVGVRSDITERKKLEQRLAMQHAVARLLADGESVGETMPRVIRTICVTLGWDCGAHWQMNKQDRLLHCVDTWSIDEGAVRNFCAFSCQQCFAPASTGFMRRIWAAGRPTWIADVAAEPGFQRADAASNAGLRAAFGFPIRIGPEVVGVLEFFVRHEREPDPALLQVLDSMGLQIGHFFARMTTQDELHRLANYDFLTGLPNRNLFNELLTHALAKAERNATRLAIMFIDLDGFKQVNDRYGHDAGDQLLVTFAQRLRKCLRKSDTFARPMAAETAARLGGDEFVVVIDDFADASELAAVAQRIRAAAAMPFDLEGAQGLVTASIGIGIYPEDGNDIETLIKAADSAMYDAKQAGKDTHRFFSAGGTAAEPKYNQAACTANSTKP